MVLKILGAVLPVFLAQNYYLHIIIGITTVIAIHAFAQGRRTTRERDLHARVILITGGFTPLGLMLIQSLAQRGARIIALSPYPVNSSRVDVPITLLRTMTKNENIFAEECDLSSPLAVRSFCTQFLSGQDKRLDAIIFAHEYQHIGSVLNRNPGEDDDRRRSESLATFLIITLLLPALLVAPADRDIRIINVVNPFYAAASIPFSPSSFSPPLPASVFLREGWRSLRMVVLARHLQRLLDSLPSPQLPRTSHGSSSIPVVNSRHQRSNIVAVCVSPGISRSDTIAPLLHADRSSAHHYSLLGLILYMCLQPLLRISTKSTPSASQTVLHALFLPTPFKSLPQTSTPSASTGELLKPGALYSECAVVHLHLSAAGMNEQSVGSQNRNDIPDSTKSAVGESDNEYLGGEPMGRQVWEMFEKELKIWDPEPVPEGN